MRGKRQGNFVASNLDYFDIRLYPPIQNNWLVGPRTAQRLLKVKQVLKNLSTFQSWFLSHKKLQQKFLPPAPTGPTATTSGPFVADTGVASIAVSPETEQTIITYLQKNIV